MIDIHHYQQNLDRTLERIKKSEILKVNKNYILDFNRYCLTQGISAGKANRYVGDILKLARFLKKDFSKCTKKDMENVVIDLEKSDYAEWTKYCYKVALRKFFKWLRGTEELPEEVRWIKMKQSKFNSKLPEDLLTEGEVKKLILHADKLRDRALISILYESGCRIYELLTIKIKHISFDTYGATINVSGKTGSRRVRLVHSIHYLQEWLNKHPAHEDPEAFVWVKESNAHELVGYARVRDILQNIAKRAGIKKKVNPHNFRHARASFMANHLTEAQLKEVFGWTQASRMASVYVHLSGRNTDTAILKMYGKVVEHETTYKMLSPKGCLRCKTENDPTSKFCRVCGMVLDEQTYRELIQKEMYQSEANKIMNMLMKDEEIKSLIAQKIKEVKN